MNNITSAINSAKNLEELRNAMPLLTRREQEIYQSLQEDNPLYFAINHGFMEAIKYYLNLGLKYEDYEEDFFEAVLKSGYSEIDEELCKDIFEKTTNKIRLANFLLICSIRYGYLFFAKLALKEGADIHITEPDTVLSLCVRDDLDDILEELLKIHKFSQKSLDIALSKAKIRHSVDCAFVLKKYGAQDDRCVVM